MAFEVGTAVGYLDLDTSGFTRGFSRARADMRTFSDENATFNDKLAATGSILRNVGSSLTKWVTVPLVGAGTATIKTAANFESGMSKVAAISGATGTQLDQLTDKALEMGAQTKFSASEAASAMEYMAMAGWKTEDMLSGIEGIMSLAAASGEDLATTSDIVTDALTAFGLSAQDASRFSDVLAAASSNANTNVSMLGESFKYVAPVAGSLGYSVEDTAIALGLMANSGIKASQGGTALRASLTRMIKPTDDAAATMKEYGISLTNTDGTMKSLGEVMSLLRSSLGSLTEAEQSQVAATLFGQEAMSGMLAIINASGADYSRLTEAIYGSEGAATSMADTMQDNLSGQLTILGSTIEGIAISSGNILLPMIKKVVEGLQGFASWINGLSDSQKEFIANALLMAASLGPVLLIVGKLVTGFLTLKKYFSGIMTAFSAGKGIIAALGGSFGPILLIIAAVVASIIALKAAWDTNFGGMRDKLSAIVEEVTTLFQTIINSINLYLIQPLGEALTMLVEMWNSNWMGIRDAVTAIWESLEMAFSAFLDLILNLLKLFNNLISGNWEGVWRNLLDIAQNLWAILKNTFGVILQQIVNVLLNIGASLYSSANRVFNQLLDGAKLAWAGIKSWINQAKQDPIQAILSIGSSLYEAGKSIFTRLLDGLKSAWSSVTSWVNDVVGWLTNKLKINAKVNIDTSRSGSYASGLDYVPRDMYVKVHEGESIRTKQQTQEDFKASSSGDTYNFYSPVPINEVEAARQMKKAKRDLAEGF